MVNDRALKPCALALLTLCSVASAHPILIHSGTLDISPDNITARFPISEHDLEHAGLNPDHAGAIADFADDLADSLAILTPQGERLTVQSVNIEPGTIEHEAQKPPTGVVAFAPPQPLTYLTFQQRTPPSAHPIRRQLQLAVRRMEAAERDTVNLRLTSDGNVETIRVAPFEDFAPFDHEALTSIRLSIDSDAPLPIIRAEIPAHLLATWRPFTLRDPDVITPEESAGMEAAIADWGQRQATLTLDDQSSPLRAARVEWLLPDGSAAFGPLGYWSARVVIILAPEDVPACHRAELNWRAFNRAVMTADLNLNHNGIVTSKRLLPGDATIRWTKSSEAPGVPGVPGKEVPHR